MKTRKRFLCIFLYLCLWMNGKAQTETSPGYSNDQLEAEAEKKDAEPNDDDYELELHYYNAHPLNLNYTSEEELIRLHLLNVLQVKNFFSYRKLLGVLLSIHELQAVPGWDIATIRKLLPYIRVGMDESVYSALKDRWRGGDKAVLFRTSQVLEKSRGYIRPVLPGASYYEGSPQNIFIRYTYNYKQLLQYGFTGAKDAGEPFFRGAQRYGFDFYSFHLFIQRVGMLKALAIGDFTVNLGQGLIQWQSFSFGKSSQTLAVKRESDCLRPYHSAGEYNFHRGVGFSLQKGKWESTLFVSSQKISTALVTDTVARQDLFSSFQQSGYHRTPAEIADRNNSTQFSSGGNIRYTGNRFMVGFNMIHFQFSRPFQKRDEPYNLYSLKGTRLTDYSFDYYYTIHNVHLFGEYAMDQWYNRAFVQGALISLNEQMDMSFLYRNISPAFQSLYCDAFTENSVPNNEKGMYTGFSYRPVAGLSVNMYYDWFVFPWLKYLVDAPSGGRDILMEVSYQPVKSWRLTSLYKNEMKSGNAVIINQATNGLQVPLKQSWRLETDYTVSGSVGFNSRLELLWLKTPGAQMSRGFLGMSAMRFKKSALSGNLGLTVFETDNYNSRIYINESDLIYNFSVPAYYGKGVHYYINIHRDLNRLIFRNPKQIKVSASVNWNQTYYPGYASVGTGLDQISGNKKSSLKLQIQLEW